jgi:PAS domain S-box-containing protein
LSGDPGRTEGLAELLLNSTGEGIYGVDLDGNCTFANPACVDLLGFESDQELLGRNMHELVHHTRPNGDPYPMNECQIFRAFREGKGVHVDDEVMWREDGTSFYAEYWSYPIDQDGELVGSVLTFVDISERKKLEMKLRAEHARAERLLLNVLPAEIARQLKAKPGGTIAQSFEEVTAVFADIVGFTSLTARLSPEQAVEILNEVFSAFDRLAGAPTPIENHCQVMANLALDMRDWINDLQRDDGIRLQVRFGMNSGSAMGAVVGTSKFTYDLWGDAINVASRMESTGEPGRIQVAEEAWKRLKGSYALEPRGSIDVKGKGTMETWFLESHI